MRRRVLRTAPRARRDVRKPSVGEFAVDIGRGERRDDADHDGQPHVVEYTIRSTEGAMRNRATWVGIAWLLAAGPIGLGAAPSDLRLVEAVKRADVKAVRALIAQRVDVNAAEPDGSTALHWAARLDNPEIVDILAAAGANARAATRYNVTPLSLACTNGNAAIIERLMKAGADPNGTSEEGQTALMTASLTGNVAALNVLLSHGANTNTREPYKGQTALMWAASAGHGAAATVLIESGAEVTAKSKAGWTSLLFAVRNDRLEAVDALLKHGANVNDVAPDGTSALNMAVVNAYFEPRVGAAGSRRRSECCPTSVDRRCTRWPGCESPGPMARPASATRRTARRCPRAT